MRKSSSWKRSVTGAAVVAVLAAVLVLSGCEEAPVTPPEPPEPPPTGVTIGDDVDVIEDDGAISAVTEDAVSFAQPVSYAPGHVVVSGVTAQTPNGLLRKVTAVSADGHTVTTAPATLEDVIESGTVDMSGALKPSDLTAESRAMLADMGIVEAPLQIASDGTAFDFNWNIPNLTLTPPGDTGLSVTVNGSLSLSLSYHVGGHYDNEIMQSARFTLTPTERVNLRARLNVPLGDAASVVFPDVKVKLFNPALKFGTIVFAAGPVPVVVQPQFNVIIGVSTTGKLTVDVVQDGHATFGIECNRRATREPTPWEKVARLVWGSPLEYVIDELAPCGSRASWHPILVFTRFNFRADEVN